MMTPILLLACTICLVAGIAAVVLIAACMLSSMITYAE